MIYPFNPFAKKNRATREGAALVVVLVLLVLMLGIVLAFFSQSILQRQISKSSASQTSAELLAQGAANTVIGDLRSEIQDSSHSKVVNPPNAGNVELYYPRSAAFVSPERVGTSDSLANLVKRSASGIALYSGGPNRASNVSTETPGTTSTQWSISDARWNAPLLLGAKSATDHTPADQSFVPPDWVYIDRGGGSPAASSGSAVWSPNLATSSTVVGRYAFTVYNEGQLLDANVAGYSSKADAEITDYQIKKPTSYKVGEAYADLREIGLGQANIDKLVEWRNAATLGSNPAKSYFDLSVQNQEGFLAVGGRNAGSGTTDRMFLGRQQLISFFTNQLGAGADLATLDALQYLGTFTRSSNRPTYYRAQSIDASLPNYDSSAPKVLSFNPNYLGHWLDVENPGNSGVGDDAKINPPFPSARAAVDVLTGSPRLDGTLIHAGDPLVSKRFPLDRLAWVTAKGPSANLSASDDIIKALINKGLTAEYLQRGTAENIQKAFGLSWNAGPSPLSGYWLYDVHVDTGGKIRRLADINPPRDPDFFELLKATINVGVLGRAREGFGADNQSSAGGPLGNNNPTITDNLRNASSINYHIFQIGANLIDQVGPDNYPTRIVVSDGARRHPFLGVVDLPYWDGFFAFGVLHTLASPPPPSNGFKQVPAVALNASNQGEIAGMMCPIIWNPHAVPPAGAYPVAPLSPQNLRISVSTSMPTYKSGVGQPDPMLFKLASKDASDEQTFDSAQGVTTVNWNAGVTYDESGTGLILPPKEGMANTSLYFQNLPNLYRQPTPLLTPGVPSGSDLRVDSQNLLKTLGGYPTTGVTEFGSSDSYIGFYWGKGPQVFNRNDPKNNNVLTTYTANKTGVGNNIVKGVTFTLEFQDGTTWVPYWQGFFGFSQFNYSSIRRGNTGVTRFDKSIRDTWSIPTNTVTEEPSNGAVFVRRGPFTFDPRNLRFNTNQEQALPPLQGDGTVATLRPGKALYEPNMDGIGIGMGGTSKDNFFSSGYYLDADGVLRRPMGAYVPNLASSASSTITGMAMATPASGTEFNRPIILHRPFRSVAEMSYAFSDNPWKNIDFSTPESGYAGLLDVFCVGETSRPTPLVAGQVDLNTRQEKVVSALLAGVYRDEWDGLSTASAPAVTSAQAQGLAKTLVDRTKPPAGSLVNVADLVGRYDPGFTNGFTAKPEKYDGFSRQMTAEGSSDANDVVQRLREAPIRALASAGQVGTWNLLIDVIAQSGRLPANSGGALDQFHVEGEKRLWVHVAIDRFTGKVVDQQTEVVSE